MGARSSAAALNGGAHDPAGSETCRGYDELGRTMEVRPTGEHWSASVVGQQRPQADETPTMSSRVSGERSTRFTRWR